MIRVGQGIDVHRFVEGKPLVVGGYRISDTGGLEGHSDADAVLHAVADALLGSIGAGDIGEHFPSTDPQWKDASSSVFVRQAVRRVAERGGRITSIDVTIVAQKPRLAPFRQDIRLSVAGLVGIEPELVSIKATTTDGLGFTGRGEGLCALAIVCVEIEEPHA